MLTARVELPHIPDGRSTMDISTDWITLAGIAGILAFLWKLSSDIAELRERMARLEGLFEGFTRKATRDTGTS